MFTTMILIAMSLSGEFLALCTTDRAHGRSQRFLCPADSLKKWLRANDGTTFYEGDMSNFLGLHRFSDDKVTMRFTWLRRSGSDLNGYQQTVIIPVERLEHALMGLRTKVLTDPETIPQSKLVFSESAQERIARICRDPLAKRALGKALRTNFFWRDTKEVYLVADWRLDFYFTTTDMNGGLCRHERMVRRKDGREHREVWYQVHT